jgi:hypothetical protein
LPQGTQKRGLMIRAPFCTFGAPAPDPGHLSCMPKNGNPKKSTPPKFVYGVLCRPRYISGTRPESFRDSDSPKCFTLGIGRPPEIFEGGASYYMITTHHREPALPTRTIPIKTFFSTGALFLVDQRLQCFCVPVSRDDPAVRQDKGRGA